MKTKYLPHNLDLDKHLKEHPPNIKNFKREHLIHILSLISEIPAYSDKGMYHGFVLVNSTKLRETGIRDYNQYLKYAVDTGVLETDGFYIKDKKSRGYRFTEQYQSIVKPIKINPQKQKGKYVIKTMKTKRDYRYLSKYFTSDMTIDYEPAYQYNSNQLKDNQEKNIENALIKHNSNYINIMNIHEHDMYFIVDTTGGRLHTNLTNLSKDYRQFIKYQNESLVEVDLKNSQPFLSLILLNPHFYENSTFNINKYTYQKLPINLTSTIMLVKSLQYKEYQDIKLFQKFVESGTIYECVRTELKNRNIANLSRDEVKKLVFQVIYSDNRYMYDAKRMFKEIFPNVYKLFGTIKKIKHSTLPILLQRIESDLFLKKIARRIARENPQMPIFTIHDSIITTCGNEHIVYTIMKDELTYSIGIEPTLKIEYWSNETR